jgi:hypothetical protein
MLSFVLDLFFDCFSFQQKSISFKEIFFGEHMRGGKRPGAGAPKGNLNAIKNGHYCFRLKSLDDLHPQYAYDLVHESLRILENRMTPEEIQNARRCIATRKRRGKSPYLRV